jgi:hypothetical protein
MQEIETHSARMFYCPVCRKANFRRHVTLEFGNSDNSANDTLRFCGFMSPESSWDQCQFCGGMLDEKQRKSGEPQGDEGGLVLPAWFFICEECGRDNFVAETVYYDNGRRSPPDVVRCNDCQSEFIAKLSSPGTTWLIFE